MKKEKKENPSDKLRRSQFEIFQTFSVDYRVKDVIVDDDDGFRVNTIFFDGGFRDTVVFLHGFGGGIGLWALNLQFFFAQGFNVRAIDLPGFGLSSRPAEPDLSQLDPRSVPTFRARLPDPEFSLLHWMLDKLDRWSSRVLPGTPFYLCGHSFGGFLAFYFALAFPTRVLKLLLLDPWGFAHDVEASAPVSAPALLEHEHRPPPPRGGDEVLTDAAAAAAGREPLPLKWAAMRALMDYVSPMSIIRVTWEGLGKALLRNFRKDIPLKFVRAGYFVEESVGAGEAAALLRRHLEELDARSARAGAAAVEFPWKSQTQNDLFANDFGLKPKPPATVVNYLYDLNTQSPATGERVFFAMLSENCFDASKADTLADVQLMDPALPITVIVGERSWVRQGELRALQPRVKFMSVAGAGHHIYLDDVGAFNRLVLGELQSFSSPEAQERADLLRKINEI